MTKREVEKHCNKGARIVVMKSIASGQRIEVVLIEIDCWPMGQFDAWLGTSKDDQDIASSLNFFADEVDKILPVKAKKKGAKR